MRARRASPCSPLGSLPGSNVARMKCNSGANAKRRSTTLHSRCSSSVGTCATQSCRPCCTVAWPCPGKTSCNATAESLRSFSSNVITHFSAATACSFGASPSGTAKIRSAAPVWVAHTSAELASVPAASGALPTFAAALSSDCSTEDANWALLRNSVCASFIAPGCRNAASSVASISDTTSSLRPTVACESECTCAAISRRVLATMAAVSASSFGSNSCISFSSLSRTTALSSFTNDKVMLGCRPLFCAR
jgi:hypothetical protein